MAMSTYTLTNKWLPTNNWGTSNLLQRWEISKNESVLLKSFLERAKQRILLQQYEYLEERPDNWRQQLYLKGRNISVGQLIYAMRANDLDTEGVAYELDLPVVQVREAQQYYQLNKQVIERDADEEKRFLIKEGIPLEPEHLS